MGYPHKTRKSHTICDVAMGMSQVRYTITVSPRFHRPFLDGFRIGNAGVWIRVWTLSDNGIAKSYYDREPSRCQLFGTTRRAGGNVG